MAETLGPNLWAQPAFDSETNLTLASGWTVSGGVATGTAVTGLIRSSPDPLVVGRQYRASIEIVSRSAGSCSTPYDGTGAATRLDASTVGVHTKDFTAGDEPAYIFGNGFTGTIDNASLREMGLYTNPTVRAVGAGSGGQGDVSPAVPTHVAGDILLLLVESCGGEPVSLSTANGFAAIPDAVAATGATTSGTQITAFWVRATSGSMSSPTVADPGNHVWARILSIKDCISTGDPWDAVATSVKASASTSASAPAVTTTAIDCLILNIIARDNDSASAAFSSWANSNLTVYDEVAGSDAGTTQGNGGGFAVAAGFLDTPGDSGVSTATVTSSINASLTIAFKPEPSGATVEEDHDESSAAGDSLSDAIVAGQAPAESSGAGDSLVDNALVGESPGESSTAGDAYADAVIVAEAIDESSTAGDEYVDEVGAAPTVVEEDMQESSEAGDSLQQNVIVGNPLEESSTPSDAAGNSIVVAEAAPESAGAGDSLSDAIVAAEGLSEAAAAADAYATQHLAAEALSDESAAGDDYFDQVEGAPTIVDESVVESSAAVDAYLDEVVPATPAVVPGSGGSLFDRPRRRKREELPVDVQPAAEAPRGLDPAWRQRVIEQTTPPRPVAPSTVSIPRPAPRQRPAFRVDPAPIAGRRDDRRGDRDAQIAAHLRAIYAQQLERDDEIAVVEAAFLLEELEHA